ncbi:MAG: outer membrane beta-barrel protein [Saprospiraceae bacterium]|nr:outer membrane beta-barrel protein [Saprospiraceae bacterium]
MQFKTIFLTLIATLSLCSLSAQTEKGTFAVGLNVSPKIMIYRDKDNNRIEHHWELQGGYFLMRNWLFGSELSYTRFRSKNDGEIEHEADTYRFGAFTRKYFDIRKTKWKPFVGLNAGYAYRNENQQSPIAGEFSFKNGGYYVNAEYGLAYFIKDRTSIHISNHALLDIHGDRSNISISLLKIGLTHNLNNKTSRE